MADRGRRRRRTALPAALDPLVIDHALPAPLQLLWSATHARWTSTCTRSRDYDPSSLGEGGRSRGQKEGHSSRAPHLATNRRLRRPGRVRADKSTRVVRHRRARQTTHRRSNTQISVGGTSSHALAGELHPRARRPALLEPIELNLGGQVITGVFAVEVAVGGAPYGARSNVREPCLLITRV